MESIVEPSPVLAGTLRPPGDKSVAHRALAFAALTNGRSEVRNWLRAGVTASMLKALAALGVETREEGDGADARLVVAGVGLGGLQGPAEPIDCGRSGATLRFLMGLAAGCQGPITLAGHPSLLRRPIERVAEPLRRMGAAIETTEGHAPVTVRGGHLGGLRTRLSKASAQVETALLLAGLRTRGAVEILLPGPARDHSLRLLRHLGVPLIQIDNRLELAPGPKLVPPFDVELVGDISAAAFPITAALLASEGELHITSVGLNPTRSGYLEVLREMGARIEVSAVRTLCGEPWGDLVVRPSRLKGVCVSGERVVRMIDEFPAFVVAALAAEGRSEVRDAAELRVKESDRIRVLVEEFARLGATIEERDDGFVIDGPQRLVGGRARGRGDHRVAMALQIAALICAWPVTVEGAEIISQSYPSFHRDLRSLGARIEIRESGGE